MIRSFLAHSLLGWRLAGCLFVGHQAAQRPPSSANELLHHSIADLGEIDQGLTQEPNHVQEYTLFHYLPPANSPGVPNLYALRDANTHFGFGPSNQQPDIWNRLNVMPAAQSAVNGGGNFVWRSPSIHSVDQSVGAGMPLAMYSSKTHDHLGQARQQNWEQNLHQILKTSDNPEISLDRSHYSGKASKSDGRFTIHSAPIIPRQSAKHTSPQLYVNNGVLGEQYINHPRHLVDRSKAGFPFESLVGDTSSAHSHQDDDDTIFDGLEDLVDIDTLEKPKDSGSAEALNHQLSPAVPMSSSVHLSKHHGNNPSESVAKHAPLKNGDIDSETQTSEEYWDFVGKYLKDKITSEELQGSTKLTPPGIHPVQLNVPSQDSKGLDDAVLPQAASGESRKDTLQEGLNYHPDAVGAALQARTETLIPSHNELAKIHAIFITNTKSDSTLSNFHEHSTASAGALHHLWQVQGNAFPLSVGLRNQILKKGPDPRQSENVHIVEEPKYDVQIEPHGTNAQPRVGEARHVPPGFSSDIVQILPAHPRENVMHPELQDDPVGTRSDSQNMDSQGLKRVASPVEDNISKAKRRNIGFEHRISDSENFSGQPMSVSVGVSDSIGFGNPSDKTNHITNEKIETDLDGSMQRATDSASERPAGSEKVQSTMEASSVGALNKFPGLSCRNFFDQRPGPFPTRLIPTEPRLPEWAKPLPPPVINAALIQNLTWFWRRYATSVNVTIKTRAEKLFYTFWKAHEIAAEWEFYWPPEEDLEFRGWKFRSLALADLPIEELELSPILERQISGFNYLASLLLEESINVKELQPIKKESPVAFRGNSIHEWLKASLVYYPAEGDVGKMPRLIYQSWLQNRDFAIYRRLSRMEKLDDLATFMRTKMTPPRKRLGERTSIYKNAFHELSMEG